MPKRKPKDCPLYKHPNGQWMKKIAGKAHYFGTDLEIALKRYAEEKDRLAAGLPAIRNDGRSSLKELANVFLSAKEKAVEASDLEQGTYDGYRKSLARLIDSVGADCRIEGLRPLDFMRIKDELVKPTEQEPTSKKRGGRKVKKRSSVTVGNDIRAIRVFFKWCWENEFIAAPIRTGTEFSPPNRKAMRRKRATEAPRVFLPSELQAILANAKKPMRAIILLGINGGIGGKDIACATVDQIEQGIQTGWLNIPRLKSGAPRRVWLWPETIEALKAYRIQRKATKNATSSTFFLTRFGRPWIRSNDTNAPDMINQHFTRLRKGICPDRTFYDCRRTFRTIAAETLDVEAVDFVMGHADAPDDMAARYTQQIGDDRVKRVCDHVRSWLHG